MKFSITEYRSMRDPLPIFHNNKKIQEVQWNQKVLIRAYMDNQYLLNYAFLAFSTSTDVAKLLHILIKLTHVHVLTIKHYMVQ